MSLKLEEPEITPFVEEDVYERDLQNVRYFVLDDGKRIKATRGGIYNMWSLALDKGLLPGKLRGEFTTFGRAEDLVRAYAAETGKKIVEVIL